MRRSRFLVCVMVAVSFPIACLAQLHAWRRPSGDQNLSIDVGGVKRTYLLHTPKTSPEGKTLPLVLIFHGGDGRANGMPTFTHFDELADRQGFLVAYPDGVDKHWNDTRGLSAADDVGFIRLLIAELERTHGVDAKRVYAAGISNGGFFSNRLACELSGKIAAIASVAATMPESLVPVCNPSRPISVLYIHGSKDPIVHIEGGVVGPNHGNSISLARASEFWRKWDETSDKPAIDELPDTAGDGTSVRRELYAEGKEKTEVLVYTIVGGGHAWPGASQYLPVVIIGKASRNLDATLTIWEFFKRHSVAVRDPKNER